MLATLCVAFLSAPVVMHADEDDSDAFGARGSAEVDYKIMKGMHVNVSEELRFLGGSHLLDRSYTQVGFSYKFLDFLKAGVSYTAIAVHKSETTMPDTEEITTNWTQARTEWWNMLQRVMNTDGSVDAILAEMQAAQDASNAG